MNRVFANPFFRLAVFVPLAALTLAFFALLVLRPSKEDNFTVRVLVAEGCKELSIRTRGMCEIVDARTGKTIGRNVGLSAGTRVEPSINGMAVGDGLFATDIVRFRPIRGGTISVNGTEYRGEITVKKTGVSFSAVNKLNLEDYLSGVLPREVGRFWPFEALKAQAIASRSFAVYEALRRKSKEYDLFADTYSQVYGGKSSERWRTDRAVESTRGKILVYNGKVFPAYFHSCCGGHTEDGAKVWGRSLKPLSGVRCPWCRWSLRFRWRSRVSVADMAEKLKSKARGISSVDDIKAGKRDESGRVVSIDVRSGDHHTQIDINDFRAMIGGDILKSSNFRVRKYPGEYLFAGFGWGHGVGMCQWGAFTMALAWWKAEKILKFYYPGTRVGNMGNVLGK